MSQSKALLMYVALLRGVNVGGKNPMPMKELEHVFVQAGCADVRTYIQSGNVVFRTKEANLATLPGRITKRIAEVFGCTTPVVLRSVDQLGDTIRSNPFLKAGVPETELHVYFMSSLPEAGKTASLDPARSLGDAFFVRGREVYLHVPNGMARTKLTNAYFDSKLGGTSTARNWRTVLKLFDLMQAKNEGKP